MSAPACRCRHPGILPPLQVSYRHRLAAATVNVRTQEAIQVSCRHRLAAAGILRHSLSRRPDEKQKSRTAIASVAAARVPSLHAGYPAGPSDSASTAAQPRLRLGGLALLTSRGYSLRVSGRPEPRRRVRLGATPPRRRERLGATPTRCSTRRRA